MHSNHRHCITKVFLLAPFLIVISLAFCPIPGHGQADTPQAVSGSGANNLLLPERTEVRVRIGKDIKSGADKAGEEIQFELAEDLYSPSHVLLLTKGTPAYGRITDSSRRGMFGKAGKLQFTCDYIQGPGNIHVPLRSDPMIVRGRDNRGTTAAVAILVTPIGMLINGKDITVKKDQEFVMYVSQDTRLPPATVSAMTNLAPMPVTPPAAPVIVAPIARPVVAAPRHITTPQAHVAQRSVFMLKNKQRVIGELISFDGKFYIVVTNKGKTRLPASTVASILTL